MSYLDLGEHVGALVSLVGVFAGVSGFLLWAMLSRLEKKLDELYAKNLMDPKMFFREPLYFEFYELWHHEGRRARMGAAMMAPDYTWWHGFYECKKRYVNFMKEADDLIKHNQKAYQAPVFPGASGSTEKPPEVFGKKAATPASPAGPAAAPEKK